ncbi:ABC transporter permease [Sphingomonas caeni]|uniref:ABC transporter permease n=1 Tax=Sphingomonas caeni TaxID=2984949 RepID=UPI002232376A|nr:ABC transporter permease [Sphingomonas caeni]
MGRFRPRRPRGRLTIGPTLSNSKHLLVIEPGGSKLRYWRDVWSYRELLAILAWRDVAVRYKQAVLGSGWAIIRPLLTMLIFTFIFGVLAKLPSEGSTPYPLLVLAGMLPWLLFAGIMNEASNSLINNAPLVGKIYFPRIIIPVATCLVALIDFVISIAIFVVMAAWYGFLPDWRVIFFPVFTLLALFVSMGPALLISALNVKYRDFRYIVPFMIQIGMYVTPVGFSSTIVPEKYQLAFSLNPMVGVIDAFRWSLLRGANPLDWVSLSISIGVALVMMLLGIAYFRGTEKTFADII